LWCHYISSAETFVPLINLDTQSDDALFRNIITYIQHAKLPRDKQQARTIVLKAENYLIVNNQLFYLGVIRSKQLNKIMPFFHRLCVPRQMRLSLLEAYHDKLSHSNAQKMYMTLRMKYYFPSMYMDCLKYCSTCNVCATIKGASVKPAPIKSLPIANLFQTVHLDMHGPINSKDNSTNSRNASEKYKYVFVMVDSLSLNARFVPLKSIDAVATASAFVQHWITHYGVPEKVVTDLGTNFVAKFTEELFNLCSITHVHTSSYHPQSNSVVESKNQLILKCLRAHCNANLSDWPNLLPYIEFAHRVQVTKSLGASPFRLMYGVEPRLIIDAQFQQMSRTPSQQEVLEHFTPKLDVMRKIMQENLASAHENTMRQQAKKAVEKQFKVGDRVFRKDDRKPPGVSKKHLKIYEGPYYILGIKNDGLNAKLMHAYTGKILKHFIHVNQLKPYREGRDNLVSKYSPTYSRLDTAHTNNNAPSGLTTDSNRTTTTSQDPIPQTDDSQTSPNVQHHSTASEPELAGDKDRRKPTTVRQDQLRKQGKTTYGQTEPDVTPRTHADLSRTTRNQFPAVVQPLPIHNHSSALDTPSAFGVHYPEPLAPPSDTAELIRGPPVSMQNSQPQANISPSNQLSANANEFIPGAFVHTQQPTNNNRLININDNDSQQPSGPTQTSQLLPGIDDDRHRSITNETADHMQTSSRPIGQASQTTPPQTTNQTVDKILQRRKFDNTMKYKVQFADKSPPEWRLAQDLPSPLVADYNVRYYQKQKKRRNRQRAMLGQR
jgi:hypothetical protein